jgi:hypothetical protein
METPADLFRNYYYILQAHTTLRPGPVFRQILQKHGIQEVDPPSKAMLDAQMREIQKLSQPSANKFMKKNTRTMIPVMSGGNWFTNVYNRISSMPSIQRNAIFMAVLSMSFLMIHLLKSDDPESIAFIEDAQERLKMTIALPLLLLAGAYIYWGDRTLQNLRRSEYRERRRRLEDAVEGDIGNEIPPDVMNITEIPVTGDLELKASDKKQDPFTLEEFQDGDKVAVIKGNKQAPLLVNALQAWILARAGESKPPIHPSTREEFGKQDVTVYTVKLVQGGGNRKKTRKGKRSYRKKYTRKQ